jgi:hypothetical protein
MKAEQQYQKIRLTLNRHALARTRAREKTLENLASGDVCFWG